MSASQALEVIRRHGTARDVQMALYYVTRGRTAMLLDLARSVQPGSAASTPAGDRPSVSMRDTRPGPVLTDLNVRADLLG